MPDHRLIQLWTIATTLATVYKITQNGTKAVIRGLFDELKGILVSDRAGALTSLRVSVALFSHLRLDGIFGGVVLVRVHGLALLFLVGCHRADRTPTAVPPRPVLSLANKSIPEKPWWLRDEVACPVGRFGQRTMSWGRVMWCDLPGVTLDANLQNGLGRLGRCIYESISAFQDEPDPDDLNAFLQRANVARISPVLCGAVRRRGQVRTYHGREVLVQRVVTSMDHFEGGGFEQSVRYRFGCSECLVASEITVQLSHKGAGP